MTKVRQALAFVRPDGAFFVYSGHNEAWMWQTGLGWPNEAEIEAAKKDGYRVETVKVEFGGDNV